MREQLSLSSYLQAGWAGFRLLQGLHAIAWLQLLATAVPLALVHANLDLSTNALAAMALLIIPVLVWAAPLLVAALIAWLLELRHDQSAP